MAGVLSIIGGFLLHLTLGMEIYTETFIPMSLTRHSLLLRQHEHLHHQLSAHPRAWPAEQALLGRHLDPDPRHAGPGRLHDGGGPPGGAGGGAGHGATR